jgi:hypothetical protein
VSLSALPPRLEPVLAELLTASATTRRVTLDEIGDAVDLTPVSADDVDALIDALEAAGRAIVGPEGARGVEGLRRVLPAARLLAADLGRRPTVAEIVARTGLSEEEVRRALALGRVMGR